MTMDDRNALLNGRFLHDLDGWTASGASYSAGDGDEHYGVCVLPVGASISQDFSVDGVRRYTLHIAVKCVVSLSAGQCIYNITDGNGNTVASASLTGGASWTDNEAVYGLAEGTTYTLTITNVSASADVKIDDVWLWYIPLTRAQIAARVHAKLGRLATERSLSTAASGDKTEGDYTYAIDEALRYVSAVDPDTGEPSVRWLDESNISQALDATERWMLEYLQKDFAVEVDTSTGPYSQQLSQKRQAIEAMLSGGDNAAGSMPVVERRLKHD